MKLTSALRRALKHEAVLRHGINIVPVKNAKTKSGFFREDSGEWAYYYNHSPRQIEIQLTGMLISAGSTGIVREHDLN